MARAALPALRQRIDRLLKSRPRLVDAVARRLQAAGDGAALTVPQRLRLKILDMLAGVPAEKLVRAVADRADLRAFLGLDDVAVAALSPAVVHEVDHDLVVDEAAILFGDVILGDPRVRRLVGELRAAGGWLGWDPGEAAALEARAAALLAEPGNARWRRPPWLVRRPASAAPAPPPQPAAAAPRRPRALRAAAMAAAALLAFLAVVEAGLPDIEQMQALIGRPSFDVSMRPDGSLAFEHPVFPVPVSVETLPAHLIDTLVEVEDRRFWYHTGFDLVGIARALGDHLAGGPGGGGSTLTQQVARMTFLNQERSLMRKLREVLLALKLELLLDKRQILELYLNRAPLGRGLYGIEQAARGYFGVRARDLNPYQAAMLVGMLPAPARRNPETDLDAAHRNAQRVLATLVARGRLTPEAHEALVGRWGGETVAGLRTGSKGVPRVEFSWFRDWVEAELEVLDLRPGETRRVLLTLDPLAQVYAQLAARRLLEAGRREDVGQIAVVAMSPDGAVRAMVGGAEYRETQYNRATQAHRQAGSAFKMLVYLAALEAGLSPETPVLDRPLTIEGRPYPRNFDGRYRGAVPMIDAVADSLNAAAVQTAEAVGRDRVADLARRLGIRSPLPNAPSLALGVAGVTPLELTAAYAVLANGGRPAEPYGLLAAQSPDGAIVYWRPPPSSRPVVAEAHVRAMNAMLREVMRRGTGTAAAFSAQAAGKTGTSQDSRDAWFVGYTGDLAATIWAGNDDDSPMDEVTGGSLPAASWNNLMSNLYDGHPPPPLPGVEH